MNGRNAAVARKTAFKLGLPGRAKAINDRLNKENAENSTNPHTGAATKLAKTSKLRGRAKNALKPSLNGGETAKRRAEIFRARADFTRKRQKEGNRKLARF